MHTVVPLLARSKHVERTAAKRVRGAHLEGARHLLPEGGARGGIAEAHHGRDLSSCVDALLPTTLLAQ